MAAVAHEKAEVVFFTNDNPGLAFPDEIIADMVSGELGGGGRGGVWPGLAFQ